MIGDEIRAERQRLNLTQKGLGELCEPPMDAAHIRRIENNRTNPTIATVERIKKALNFKAKEMTKNTEQMLVEAECMEMFGKKPSEMDKTELLEAISIVANKLGYIKLESAANAMLAKGRAKEKK